MTARFIIACFWTAQALAWADITPLPSIEGHLTAPGKQLTQAEKTRLDDSLGLIQRDFQVDLAILVLATLPKEPIEDFGLRAYRRWNIGGTWKHGGALAVISPDRKQCIIIQGETDAPFPATMKKYLERQLCDNAPYQGFSSTLAAFTERSRRILAQKHQQLKLQEPLERDSKAAWAYGTASIVITACACLLSLPRRGGQQA